MPSRIVREGINSSARVDSLSCDAELFYRRLINVVDDYGRFEADPILLISRAFPRRATKISTAKIEVWLKECSSEPEPLILVYSVGRKRFLEIQNFKQPTRTKSKCSAPEEGVVATENNCFQYSSISIHENAEVLSASDTEYEIRNTDTKQVLALSGAVGVSKPIDQQKAWFDAFWALYPRKVDKANAEKAFGKKVNTQAIYDKAIAGIKAQRDELLTRPPDKIPHPTTWINGERWNDETQSRQVGLLEYSEPAPEPRGWTREEIMAHG